MWNSGRASVSLTATSSCGRRDLERMDRNAITADSSGVRRGDDLAEFACARGSSKIERRS
jgi:hypothetical protein